MPFIAGRTRYDLTSNITQPAISRLDVLNIADNERLQTYVITMSANSTIGNGRGIPFSLKVFNGTSYGIKVRTSPAPDRWEDFLETTEVATPTGYTSLDGIMTGTGTKKAKWDAALDWCVANGLLGGIAGTRA